MRALKILQPIFYDENKIMHNVIFRFICRYLTYNECVIVVLEFYHGVTPELKGGLILDNVSFLSYLLNILKKRKESN